MITDFFLDGIMRRMPTWLLAIIAAVGLSLGWWLSRDEPRCICDQVASDCACVEVRIEPMRATD